MNFTFKGIRKSYIISANIRKPFTHEDEISYFEIPNRPGSIKKKRKVKMRKIPVEVWVDSTGFESLETLEEDMANWLWSEEVEELFFDDNPNRIYFAMASVLSKPISFMNSARVDLLFTCPDPFKYGELKTSSFVNGIGIVNNLGTTTSQPVYEIVATDAITHIDVISDESYFRIGKPRPIDVPTYNPVELISSYPLTDLIGWTTASEVDNGYVAGSMQADATGMSAAAFGTTMTPVKWQGPARRRALATPLQDFQIDVEVDFLNLTKQTGMVEMYLKDAGGNTIAKIGIEDRWSTRALVTGKFQVGNVTNRAVNYSITPKVETAWNDYKGVLRIIRKGKELRPYFALIRPDGKHEWVLSSYSWTDENSLYQNPVVEVVLAIRVWPDTNAANMKLRKLKVYRLNEQPDAVPIIAHAGDQVIIDTTNSSILINGEDQKSLKDLGASFFELPKGVSTVLLEPADKLTGQIRYRERYR